jgi:hypothetical protein
MPCPEELQALEALWRLKHDGRRLPRRRDFRPEELKPWLGNLAVVAVERQPMLRFRVLLSGTVLDDYRGYGITGQYVDTLCSGPVSSLPRFMQCVEEATPVRFVHDNSFNSAIYRRMAKLLLPLSDDGMHVDRVLAALYPLPANDAAPATLPLAAGF